MAERFQVYKCELCGNIVEVLHGSDGTLVCCDQEMFQETFAASQGLETP